MQSCRGVVVLLNDHCKFLKCVIGIKRQRSARDLVPALPSSLLERYRVSAQRALSASFGFLYEALLLDFCFLLGPVISNALQLTSSPPQRGGLAW